MNIKDYLTEDHVLLNVEAKDKEDAIRAVGGRLEGAPAVTDFAAFLEDVFERERLCTTGIGNEVAIPHARSEHVKDFVIAFGRCEDGVDFASVSGEAVKLIFLMGTPKDSAVGAYLKTLAHLSHLLQQEAFRQRLLEASTPAEVMDAFSRIEA